MELEEAKKTLKFEIDFENFCMKVDHYASNEKLKTIVEAISTVLQELDRLKKENEELRKGNEVIDRFPLVRTVKRWLVKQKEKQHGKS